MISEGKEIEKKEGCGCAIFPHKYIPLSWCIYAYHVISFWGKQIYAKCSKRGKISKQSKLKSSGKRKWSIAKSNTSVARLFHIFCLCKQYFLLFICYLMYFKLFTSLFFRILSTPFNHDVQFPFDPFVHPLILQFNIQWSYNQTSLICIFHTGHSLLLLVHMYCCHATYSSFLY